MPEIRSDELGIALDMNGCPNRCRHCWLGSGTNRKLSTDDLRWAVGPFRAFVEGPENSTPITRLAVASWFREPDYADNYRELYGLEAELGDCKRYGYELLSIWRLAREPGYAEWAKQVGPDTCQISFFGMEETNDWFHRRRGAFRDALTATERLLEVGMKPRWQVFLTTKLIPELSELLELVEKLRLRERVQELGTEFTIFMHTPGPDGNARHIEDLRPDLADLKLLPAELIESSRKHFKREELWYTEGELVARVLNEEEAFPYAYPYPERLWMVIKDDWDVFSNFAGLEDWWRLGNLRADPVAAILERFVNNDAPGLAAIHGHSPKALVKRFGDPSGTKIYTDSGDLLSLFVEKHCAEMV